MLALYDGSFIYSELFFRRDYRVPAFLAFIKLFLHKKLLFFLCLNLCRLYNILWQRRFTNTVYPLAKAHCILWRITNTVYYHYYEKVENKLLLLFCINSTHDVRHEVLLTFSSIDGAIFQN